MYTEQEHNREGKEKREEERNSCFHKIVIDEDEKN